MIIHTTKYLYYSTGETPGFITVSSNPSCPRLHRVKKCNTSKRITKHKPVRLIYCNFFTNNLDGIQAIDDYKSIHDIRYKFKERIIAHGKIIKLTGIPPV